jgi:hypothetical protein
MVSLALALFTGLAAGTHAATWGMYKDSAYEGFHLRRYARSVILGGVVAVALQLWRPLPLDTPADFVLLFGLTYVLERALVEFVKVFFRVENQAKYHIPMQLSIGGRVVEHRAVRAAAGALYATGIAAVALGVTALQPLVDAGARWLPFIVGTIGGFLCALGGAWKDAPIEGFSWPKFFRSPLIAGAWGAVLALLTPDLVTIAFGGLGFSIATIETYKKFHAPAEAPGKFTGKPILYPDVLRWRHRVVPLFAGIWVFVLGTVGAAVAAVAQ